MNRRRYHLPLSIILLNVILAVFPIVAGTLIYNGILKVVTLDLVENNLNLMKQNMDSYEENYSRLGKSILPLQNALSVIRCKNLEDPYSEGNVIRLLDALEDFSLIMSPEDDGFVIDNFLYFCTNDVVITPLSIYREDDFFDNQFGLSDGDIESWIEEMRGSVYSMQIIPQQEIIYQGEKIEANLFIHSLFHYKYGTDVYYIALISRDFFINELSGMDFSSQGSFSVINNGRVIFQEGKGELSLEEYLDDPDYKDGEGYTVLEDNAADKLVTHVYSLQRKTSFIIEQNSLDQISVVLENMKRSVMFGGIAYVLIATILTYFLTRHSRSALMSSYTVARHQLFGGLYSGTIISRENMEKAWATLGLSRDEKLWGMVHIALNPDETSLTSSEILMRHNMDIYRLREKLSSQMPSLFTLHVPSSQRLRFYLVHGFDTDDAEEANRQWREDLQWLYNFFTEVNDINLYVGYGLLQSDRMQLYISHAQARQSLNGIIRFHQPGIRQYVEENDSKGTPQLPDNIFNILESHLFHGDAQGIDDVFDSFRSALLDPQLTLVMRQYLITKIYGAVVEITERTGQENHVSWTPEFFSKMQNARGVEELFLQLREKTKAASVKIVDKKKSHNSELLDRIISEIHGNLDNQSLNASMIATSLEISEIYLYQFFKEQTGTTFASYLESRRMEKARELLRTSDCSIKEISDRVGYGSSNTFGRAFKRNYGVNAGQFRTNRQENL